MQGVLIWGGQCLGVPRCPLSGEIFSFGLCDALRNALRRAFLELESIPEGAMATGRQASVVLTFCYAGLHLDAFNQEIELYIAD